MESSLPINPFVKRRKKKENQRFLKICGDLFGFYPSCQAYFVYVEEPKPDPGIFGSLKDQYRTSRVLQVRYEGRSPAV